MTAFLAVRVNKGGCGVALATGVFLWLDSAGLYNVTSDLGKWNLFLLTWLISSDMVFLLG